MILSGKEIVKHLGKEIIIEPFIPNGSIPIVISVSSQRTDDIRPCRIGYGQAQPASTIEIPESGYVLQPNTLYLGRTNEYTRTDGYIPMLEGRSSVGRLGVFIHVTAGFGDVGFAGYWTLKSFVSSRYGFIPMSKSARSTIMTSMGNTISIPTESIRTIRASSRACFGKTLKS